MSLAETTVVDCPYCAEPLELALDCPEGQHQYTEDCHVCCQPMVVHVSVLPGEPVSAWVAREDD
jgi:hypothetical protein